MPLAQLEDELRQTLQQGQLSTADLEATLVSLAEKHSVQIHQPLEVFRMTMIGSLRSHGYIIPRQRGTYKITGHEEKEQLVPASEWPTDQRKIINWFLEQPTPTYDYLAERVKSFARRSHALAPATILSYDLATDKGRILPDGSIGVMRFANYPRFRILLPNNQESLLKAARLLAKASVRPVHVVGADLYLNDPFRVYSKRKEAVYDCEHLANDYESLLSKGARGSFRTSLKTLEFRAIESTDLLNIQLVIGNWKKGPSGLKQRQLAISRDYVAADLAVSRLRDVSFIGFREGFPASVHILDRLPNDPTMVAEVVEKSLNYSSQPGGHNSTTDANLFLTCKALWAKGIRYLAGGSYDGGTKGLIEHKQRFASQELDIMMPEYELPELCYKPERIR